MNLDPRKIRAELGVAGMASVALLVGALFFLFFIQQPLEARSERLSHLLARSEARPLNDSQLQRASTTNAKMAAFYRFFDHDKQATDWLQTLHGIGQAAGVEFLSADYRVHKTATPIERMEISLPVAGTYEQIRVFLKNALREIPVLSLDQLSFRRSSASDATVHAQLRLTLHTPKQ
jgi:Tfp pilus assembly protein PilO